MRGILLILACVGVTTTLVAFLICSTYDSPEAMLTSTTGLVAALSLGFTFVCVIAYTFVMAFEQKGMWRSLIDEIAVENGIRSGERDPEKLVRLIDGTSLASLGHRCRVDHGVMGVGHRIGRGKRGRLAILMLEYSWDGGDRSRSKILPAVVMVKSVSNAITLSLSEGPFPDESRQERFSEILQTHPGLGGEIVDGSIYLTIKHSTAAEFLWGIKHPFASFIERFRQDYQSMLDAIPKIRDACDDSVSD